MTSSRLLPVRLSPRPLRSLGRRFLSSAFARDVRDRGGWSALGMALILVLALLVGLLSGDLVVTWTGLHHVPEAVYSGR